MECRVVPSWLDTYAPDFGPIAFPLQSGAVGPLTAVQCGGPVGTVHDTGSGSLDPHTTYTYVLDTSRAVGWNDTWTYQESYTYTLDSTTGPPTPGAVSHEWGTFTYVFAATSSPTGSYFTLAADLSIHQTGSSTDQTTSADGATAVVASSWQVDQDYTRTIANETDLNTGEAYGTDSGTGSATENSTASGTYSRPISAVATGAVTGTENGQDHHQISYAFALTLDRDANHVVTYGGTWDTTGSGSSSQGYTGSGSYTVNTASPDGSWTTGGGMITESGDDHWNYSWRWVQASHRFGQRCVRPCHRRRHVERYLEQRYQRSLSLQRYRGLDAHRRRRLDYDRDVGWRRLGHVNSLLLG